MTDERLMEIVEAMESEKCPHSLEMIDAVNPENGDCVEADCAMCWGNAIRLELAGDPI